MLSFISSESAGKAPMTSMYDLPDVVQLEEAKYSLLCAAISKDPDGSAYMVDGIFDQALFWAQQKASLCRCTTHSGLPRWTVPK